MCREVLGQNSSAYPGVTVESLMSQWVETFGHDTLDKQLLDAAEDGDHEEVFTPKRLLRANSSAELPVFFGPVGSAPACCSSPLSVGRVSEQVQRLLDAGADANSTDHEGVTPLIVAAGQVRRPPRDASGEAERVMRAGDAGCRRLGPLGFARWHCPRPCCRPRPPAVSPARSLASAPP